VGHGLDIYVHSIPFIVNFFLPIDFCVNIDCRPTIFHGFSLYPREEALIHY
jgi:hypothetical protein